MFFLRVSHCGTAKMRNAASGSAKGNVENGSVKHQEVECGVGNGRSLHGVHCPNEAVLNSSLEHSSWPTGAAARFASGGDAGCGRLRGLAMGNGGGLRNFHPV